MEPLATPIFFVGIAAKSTCAEWYYLAAGDPFCCSIRIANYRISKKKIHRPCGCCE
jgi:hypothetical protein